MTETTANTPQTREPTGLTVQNLFQKYEANIKKAIPQYVNGDKLLKMALSSIQRNELLMKCHPATLVGGFIQAALLDLQLDGVTGEAYLVPFWNTKKNRYDAQFMIGYKGLRKLVSNTDKVDTFLPQVVHEGDIFDYNLAESKIITHKFTDQSDYDKPILFYSIVQYKNGHIEHLIMSKKEVDAIRDRHSRTYQTALKYKKVDSIWQQHYEAMGMKTVMRRHAKYLPLSAEKQRAVALDEFAESGVPQDLGLIVDESETPTPSEEHKDEVPMPARISETEKTEASAIENPEQAERTSEPKQNGVRQMKSKFANTCVVCSGSIAVGEDCFYSSSTKKVWHTGCDTE